MAKKLLQMFPKYDKKQFANVVTGDEAWVHYFVCLFVCVEVFWPSQPNGVMSSAVSLPNHTFTGQA